MLWRHRKAGDFNAEIEAHLRLEADRLQEQGWSEVEAVREARRSFGNITRAREQFYESRGWLWGAQLWQDLRFGLRMLQKPPGAALVAALTLALALGVNTAIFSVVNTALLTPLPVPHPNELVMLTDPNAAMTLGGLLTGTRSLLTYPEFQKIRARATTLADVCAVQLTLARWPIRMAGSGLEQAYGRLVSESYFSTFGLRPAIGRFFTQRDATGIGKDPYAVISYDYWQRRFGGSPAAIGASIRLRKTSIVIIGVSAKGFRGETAGQDPDLWLPVEMQPLVMPSFDGLRDSLPNAEGKLMWLPVFGRRKPGVSMARVQAEMNVLSRNRSARLSSYHADAGSEAGTQSTSCGSSRDSGGVSGSQEFHQPISHDGRRRQGLSDLCRTQSSSANRSTASLNCGWRGHAGIQLVRPDGYIAYSAHSSDSTAALESLRSLLEIQTR